MIACVKGNHTGDAASVIHEHGPKTVRNCVSIANCIMNRVHRLHKRLQLVSCLGFLSHIALFSWQSTQLDTRRSG